MVWKHFNIGARLLSSCHWAIVNAFLNIKFHSICNATSTTNEDIKNINNSWECTFNIHSMFYKTHLGSSLIWFLVCEETSTQPWQSFWRCRFTVMVDMWNYGASSSSGIGQATSTAYCKSLWSRRHSEALASTSHKTWTHTFFCWKQIPVWGEKSWTWERRSSFFLDTISANKKLQIWDKIRNEVLDVFPNNLMKTLIYFYVWKVIVGLSLTDSLTHWLPFSKLQSDLCLPPVANSLTDWLTDWLTAD